MKKVRTKNISRFKRDVVLTRHRSTTGNYTYQQIQARKRIRKQAKVLNQMISKLNKYPTVKSLSKDILVESLKKSGMITKNGRVRTNLPTHLTTTDYRNIEKSYQRFISSESSTPKGLRNIISRQRRDLLASTSNQEFVDSLSDRDIMNFNRMYSDSAFDKLSRTVGSDLVKVLAEDAGQYKMSKENFADTILSYTESENDVELIQAANKIYDKYIKYLQ